MARILPVRINFRLPDGWQPASPDEVGAPGAAFVALHPESRDGFTANITIGGDIRNDAASLAEIADESVGRMRQKVAGVQVVKREQTGTAESPGLLQLLRLRADVNGTERDLVQAQVYVSMSDATDPSKRAVVELMLTVTPEQFPTAIDDFQGFVRSVRPAEPGTGPTAG